MSFNENSFKERCQKYFGTDSVYAILGIREGSNVSEVNKAYREMCRKIHPDRVEEEEKHEACEKFKIIGKIKDILTNNSQNSSNSSFCVSTEHIQRANTFYKGSVREEEDIRQAYQTGKGSIKFILEVVPFVTVEDKPRIIEMVMGWISQGVVPEYERFSNESCTKRIRRQKK